jgi:hypothetical protein
VAVLWARRVARGRDARNIATLQLNMGPGWFTSF